MLRAAPARTGPTRNARETWFDHGVLALALGLLLSGFGTVIEGNDWWITTLMVSILAGLTCGVLRALGARFVAPIAVLVELFVLAWIFVPETFVSIIPTAQTVRVLADLVSAAQTIIVEEQAPVGAAKPIVLVVASSFGLIVIVADFLLQRKRAAPLVGLLILSVYVTPALISGQTPSIWLFLAVAALWLVLLRSRTTSAAITGRRASPALAVGAAALAAAVAFPLVTPDISAVASSWGKPPSAVFGRGINPMLELGQNLRRNSTAVGLTYTTTLGEPQYLKVATLRDFTGKTWKPTTTFRGDRLEGEVDVSSDVKKERVATTITIERLRSSSLPVPYPPVGRSGLKGEWRFQRAGLALTSREDTSEGQTYTVTSLDVQPTAEQMRDRRTYVGSAMDSYVELPDKVPAIIEQTARKVTAEADNDYDRVVALQEYLRNGDFRYSETSPVANGYDGNGVEVIAKFLQAKAGYCVHFSSAMAVMARTLDIPSRIAVGYAPDNSTTLKDGQTTYLATSDDLHAWTEIYFEGVGWTRFDPTTGIGSATAFQEPITSTPTDQGTTPTAPDVVNSRGQDQPQDSTVAATVATTNTAPRTAFATLAGLIVVGGLPWLVRTVRRRWRINRGRLSVEPLWSELEDIARDFGVAVSAADTPRGFATALGQRPGIDEVALGALLQRVELSRFSREVTQEGDGVADAQAVMASVRGGASWRKRLRAALLPRSLAARSVATRTADTTPLPT